MKRELLGGFLDSTRGRNNALDQTIPFLKSHECDPDTLNEIYRNIRNIRTASETAGVVLIKEVSGEMENLFQSDPTRQIDYAVQLSIDQGMLGVVMERYVNIMDIMLMQLEMTGNVQTEVHDFVSFLCDMKKKGP